jgi:uncharacterized protein YegL
VKTNSRCLVPLVSNPLLVAFLGGILIWAAPLAATQMDIMLVLDNSGSMRQNDPNHLMKDVVTRFARELNPQTRLGIVVFGKGATLALPLTKVQQPEFQSSLEESLRKIDYSTALTDTPAGVERAIYELRQSQSDLQRVIILLTDGIVDIGNPEKGMERERWLRSNLAPNAHQLNIKIFAIAFTEEADFQLMQSVAQTTDGEYFRILRAQDIEGVFRQIGLKLGKTTPSSASATPPAIPSHPAEAKADNSRTLLAGMILAAACLLVFLTWRTLMKRKGSPSPSPVSIRPAIAPTAPLEPPPALNSSQKPDKTRLPNLVDPGENLSPAPPHGATPPPTPDRNRIAAELPVQPQKLSPQASAVASSQPMCAKHPLWKATELCPKCQTKKCKNCMTERGGVSICTECAKTLQIH